MVRLISLFVQHWNGKYSGDLNSKLVLYSNGPKQFTSQMIRQPNGGLNNKLFYIGLNNILFVSYSDQDQITENVYYSYHHLKSEPFRYPTHVCDLNTRLVCYSDPHQCISRVEFLVCTLGAIHKLLNTFLGNFRPPPLPP